ncbi:DUF2199 domain-containing protein [Neobacillus sp. PS3-12]|uniref:DUF2199 domain-containing protein n=1 Tax=Neobacillus sp. PS3-12 TaxID=3070677 RepID=UPI0035A9199A
MWEVWVSLSKTNSEKTIEYWEIEGRENELEPMFGWLSTSLPSNIVCWTIIKLFWILDARRRKANVRRKQAENR